MPVSSLLTAAVLLATTGTPHPLTNLRVQPEPDPSWEDDGAAADDAAADEEVSADDADEPEAESDASDEAADSEEPEAETTEGAAQPTYPVQPTEPTGPGELVIPPKRGVGLMATAGALGGVAWAVMGARVAIIKKECTGDEVDLESVSEDDLEGLGESASNCLVQGRGRNAGLWVLQALPNAVNWGIAPAAATVRAKYDAARSVKTGEVERRPGVFIGTGATLLAAGVIGRITVAAIRIRSLSLVNGVAANCVEDGNTQVDDFFDCYANRNALLYGMHQLSSSAVAGGAGLLAYGVVYKRERTNYERVYGGEKQASRVEFTVQPQLSLDYTGVSAHLRF